MVSSLHMRNAPVAHYTSKGYPLLLGSLLHQRPVSHATPVLPEVSYAMHRLATLNSRNAIRKTLLPNHYYRTPHSSAVVFAPPGEARGMGGQRIEVCYLTCGSPKQGCSRTLTATIYRTTGICNGTS